MKRFFTVLICLTLSCLFLLSACDAAGENAVERENPHEKVWSEELSCGHDGGTENPHKELSGAQDGKVPQENSGDQDLNDAQDGGEEPHYEMLSALYPWIGTLREEDILKIRMETAANGVAPGHFRNIAYSSDREDVRNVYEEILLSSVKEISESEEEGGGYVQYDLCTKDGTFTLTFSNENVYVNGVSYHFEEKLYQLCSASTECNAFITYADMTDMWDTFAVFTCGAESVKLGEFKGLGAFEFTEYTGECDMNVKLRLVSDTVNLKILSENLFMIEDDYTLRVFEITGEKDFSEFFKLASATV